jgi:hypothetical protein
MYNMDCNAHIMLYAVRKKHSCAYASAELTNATKRDRYSDRTSQSSVTY